MIPLSHKEPESYRLSSVQSAECSPSSQERCSGIRFKWLKKKRQQLIECKRGGHNKTEISAQRMALGKAKHMKKKTPDAVQLLEDAPCSGGLPSITK